MKNELNIVERIQVYKDLYQAELDYGLKLDGRLSINLTVLTITGTGVLTCISGLFPARFCLLWYINCVLCAISLVSFAYCVFRFYKAYYGYIYQYVNLKEINNGYWKYKHNFQKSQLPPETQKQADFWSEQFLFMSISNNYFITSVQNRVINLRKADNLRKLIFSVVLNLGLVAITFIYQIVYKNIIGGTLYG